MNKAKRYPKVYIIILNYNGWQDTIECLESVLRNDYPNYQVIVVDNGSPNNSMEYIKAWRPLQNPGKNSLSLHVIASEAKQSNVEGIFGQAKDSTPYFQRGRIRIQIIKNLRKG